MNVWIENIIRFVVLFLLQVLLFNNISILGYCLPFVFVLFLIALPTTLPRWIELVIGFFSGLLLDIFSNTLGVQMAACTLISYVRPLLIRSMIQDNDRLLGTLSSATLGIQAYWRIVVILVVLHHSMMFFLVEFSFTNWWITLIQIVFSSLISILLILGYDLLR